MELPASGCSRRPFDRRLCPPGPHPPVAAEPFPADCLQSTPLQLEPPTIEHVLAIEQAEQVLPMEQAEQVERDPLQAPTVMALCPASPARSKRLVIGGVVRPAKEEKSSAEDDLLQSLRTMSKSASRSSPVRGMLQKPSAAAYHRIDLDDSVCYDGKDRLGAPRDSSLVRSYETLGAAEFHSMAEDDWRRPFNVPVCAPKRPQSSSGKLSACSAMALDLGLTRHEAETPRSGRECNSHSFKDTLNRSASLSVLHTSKKSPTGWTQMGAPSTMALAGNLLVSSKSTGKLLPALPNKQATSSGSVAWSMRMAKSTAKRSDFAAVF